MGIFVCGFSDAFAIGNPIYPLFDIRNVEKKCSNWFVCYSPSDMIESIMNEFDIMAKLGTSDRGKSESIFGDWTWKDCRLYEAVQLATEYISEGDHPY